MLIVIYLAFPLFIYYFFTTFVYNLIKDYCSYLEDV